MMVKKLLSTVCFLLLIFIQSGISLNVSVEKHAFPKVLDYRNPVFTVIIKVRNFENKTFYNCELYDTFPLYASPVNKERKTFSGLPCVVWNFSLKPYETKIFSYNLSLNNPPRKGKELEIPLYASALKIGKEYIYSNSPSVTLKNPSVEKLGCNFNFVCEPEIGENPDTCPQDCYSFVCGNGLCENGESPFNCPEDCNANLTCGNKKCEIFENYTTCCMDCPCPKGKVCVNNTCVDTKTFCGNGICEDFENFASCPKDCPSGGKDNFCDGVEDNICDPDCEEQKGFDPDCVRKNNKIFILLIGGVIAFFVVLIIYAMLKRKEEVTAGFKEIYRTQFLRLF